MMINKITGTCIFLALTLTAGCSTLTPEPAKLECPVVETPSCPVCPGVDTQIVQCPEPRVVEKIVTVKVPAPAPAKAATAGELNLPIVGAVEWATIEPGDIRLPARIDTGTATTYLHAEDIQLVEKDGKRWVHFTVLDPAGKEPVKIEQRLRRKIVTKLSNGEEQHRYVVRLWVTLADNRSLVEVTLTDRDNMEYPLVLGRDMLVDTVIVDVSRQQRIKK